MLSLPCNCLVITDCLLLLALYLDFKHFSKYCTSSSSICDGSTQINYFLMCLLAFLVTCYSPNYVCGIQQDGRQVYGEYILVAGKTSTWGYSNPSLRVLVYAKCQFPFPFPAAHCGLSIYILPSVEYHSFSRLLFAQPTYLFMAPKSNTDTT